MSDAPELPFDPNTAGEASATAPAATAPAAAMPPLTDVTPQAVTAQLAPTAVPQTPVQQLHDRIVEQLRKIYVGQDELVLGTLVALVSQGHVLIESVPGL